MVSEQQLLDHMRERLANQYRHDIEVSGLWLDASILSVTDSLATCAFHYVARDDSGSAVWSGLVVVELEGEEMLTTFQERRGVTLP